MIVVFRDDPFGSSLLILWWMIPALLPLYLALAMGMWARRRVASARALAFEASSPVPIDGESLARELLASGNARARVVLGGGAFADFYDPIMEELRLSPEVASGRTPWALAVAARESGHALQHGRGDLLVKLKAPLVFLARLGRGVGWLTIASGMVFLYPGLCYRGALLELGSMLTLAATVPLERRAIRRALATLPIATPVSHLRDDPRFGHALEASAWAQVEIAWPDPRPLRLRKSLMEKASRL